MRWSYSGDLSEAQKWTARVSQELFRLETLMNAQGVEQQKRVVQLSDTAYCILNIAAGIKAAHIVTQPVPTGDTGGFYFEFASSGFPVETWDGSLLGTNFTAYSGCVVGGTFDKNLQMTAKVLTGQRQNYLNLASKVGRLFQAQLEDGHAAYTRGGAIFGSYAPTNPYTGIYASSVNWERPIETNIETGAEQALSQRDTGFDVPLEYNVGGNAVTLAVLRGDADWPRATCIQRVTAGTVSKDFAVYIDAFAQVSVFPLNSITPFADFAQNIDPDYVKTASVAFPAWAFVPPAKAMSQGASWFTHSPDLLWKFNHLGTKAVCVLHERESAIWDTAYLADPDTNYFGSTVKAGIGTTGTRQRFWNQAVDSTVTDVYTFGRGVFEIGITISLTGGGPGDFSVELTANEVRTPRGSDRGTFMVDYAWQDIIDKDIHRGDMLLLDIERWYQPSAAVTDPSAAKQGLPFFLHVHTWGDASTERPDPELPDHIIFDTHIDALFAGRLDGESINAYLAGIPRFDPTTGTHPRVPPVSFPDPYPGLDQPFVTGDPLSFFSLRKRRDDDESEVLAINGEALLGIDLKTASFAIAIESEQTVDRTVPIATDHPALVSNWQGWHPSQPLAHRISHPGVAIYTQARLRKVLMPDASDSVTADLQAKAEIDPRTLVASSSWVRLAANDMSDWTERSNLRDFQMLMAGNTLDFPLRLPQTRPAHPLQTLTVQERNWWLATCVNSSNRQLLLLTNPNFGWSVYTAEVINRTQNVNTTFFTHPNGSWAFYDDNRIYNTYGVPDIFQTYNINNATKDSGKYGERGFYFLSSFFSFEYQVAFYGNDYIVPGDPIACEPAAYSQMRKYAYDGAGPAPTYLNDGVLVLSGTFSGTGQPNGPSSWLFPYPAVVKTWADYDSLNPIVNADTPFKHQVFDHIHFERNNKSSESSFFDQYNAAVAKLGVNDLTPITSADLRATFTPMAVRNFQLAVKITWAGQEFYAVDDAYRNIFDLVQADLPNPTYRGGFLLKPRLSTASFYNTSIGTGPKRIVAMPPTFSTCLMIDP